MENRSSPLSKGTLLLASPEIDEGIYRKSVILLCDHSPAGSFGLIINKMQDPSFFEEIPLNSLKKTPHSFRIGGPMQPNQIMLIHGYDSIPEQTLTICPGVYLGGDETFLKKLSHECSDEHYLICFGFAGWGNGALEQEVESGLWYTYPAKKDLIFSQSSHLWSQILKMKGGKFEAMSQIPDDLTQN